jgi:hypothetical protein
MEDGISKKYSKESQESELIKQVFEDKEAKNNLVGLFNLLLKIDKRVNPQNYISQRDVQ